MFDVVLFICLVVVLYLLVVLVFPYGSFSPWLRLFLMSASLVFLLIVFVMFVFVSPSRAVECDNLGCGLCQSNATCSFSCRGVNFLAGGCLTCEAGTQPYPPGSSSCDNSNLDNNGEPIEPPEPEPEPEPITPYHGLPPACDPPGSATLGYRVPHPSGTGEICAAVASPFREPCEGVQPGQVCAEFSEPLRLPELCSGAVHIGGTLAYYRCPSGQVVFHARRDLFPDSDLPAPGGGDYLVITEPRDEDDRDSDLPADDTIGDPGFPDLLPGGGYYSCGRDVSGVTHGGSCLTYRDVADTTSPDFVERGAGDIAELLDQPVIPFSDYEPGDLGELPPIPEALRPEALPQIPFSPPLIAPPDRPSFVPDPGEIVADIPVPSVPSGARPSVPSPPPRQAGTPGTTGSYPGLPINLAGGGGGGGGGRPGAPTPPATDDDAGRGAASCPRGAIWLEDGDVTFCQCPAGTYELFGECRSIDTEGEAIGAGGFLTDFTAFATEFSLEGEGGTCERITLDLPLVGEVVFPPEEIPFCTMLRFIRTLILLAFGVLVFWIGAQAVLGAYETLSTGGAISAIIGTGFSLLASLPAGYLAAIGMRAIVDEFWSYLYTSDFGGAPVRWFEYGGGLEVIYLLLFAYGMSWGVRLSAALGRAIHIW